MAQRFDEQYSLLGLSAPCSDMDPRDEAEVILHAACKILGLDPSLAPLVHDLKEEFQVMPVAIYRLQVVRKVIVGDWIADWNSSQPKWSPFHWLNSPGFRFFDSFYGLSSTHSTCGSRLCFETQEQSDFMGIKCIALYADVHGVELAKITPPRRGKKGTK